MEKQTKEALCRLQPQFITPGWQVFLAGSCFSPLEESLFPEKDFPPLYSFFVYSFSVYFCFLSLHNPCSFKNLKRLWTGMPCPSQKTSLVLASSSWHISLVNPAGESWGETSDNPVFVYGVFFKSSTKILCSINLFQWSSWREGSRSVLATYVTTNLLRSPVRPRRWRASLLGRQGRPLLREQLCPLKQVAALEDKLIGHERWVGWELLGKHWGSKRSDPVGTPPAERNLHGFRASSGFVHRVPSTELRAQVTTGAQ